MKKLANVKEFVKLVEVPQMRVVSHHAWGRNVGEPEGKVDKLQAVWLKEHPDVVQNIHYHQFFGFNNPNPQEGKEYGYETWISVPEDYDVGAGTRTKIVEGALYIALPFRFEKMGWAYKTLMEWMKSHDQFGYHPNGKHLTEYYDQDVIPEGTLALEYIPDPLALGSQGKAVFEIWFPIQK